MRNFIASLAFTMLTVGFASADAIVYDNNFTSGSTASLNAYSVSPGNISDSFVLSSSTSLTGVYLLVEEPTGFPPVSLNWYILDNGNPTDPFDSEPGVTTLASAAVTPIDTSDPFNRIVAPDGADYNVDQVFFPISTPVLSADTTYWLEINNEPATILFWNQSDGPSTAFGMDGFTPADTPGCNGLCTSSEAFRLLAAETPTPEPGSVVLVGAGLAGFIAFRHLIGSPFSRVLR